MTSYINPAKLEQARLSRGLSISAAAKLLGVSRQTLTAYEKGTRPPNSESIFKIISTFDYPISYYQKDFVDYKHGVTFFRKRKSSTNTLQDSAKNRVYNIWDMSDELQNYVDFLPPDISLTCSSSGKHSFENIEKLTLQLRNQWGLGNLPISNLTHILQEKGILISNINLESNKIDAFTMFKDNKYPHIFLGNDEYSMVRLRFSLAHELGHILMHQSYTEEDLKNNDIDNCLEEEADYFAAAFLLPKETFSRDVYSSSISHFCLLKKKWKVSISCMINRCICLGLLTDNQVRYLKSQMTDRKYWYHEPYDDIWNIEKPFAYNQAIKLILKAQVSTPEELVSSFALNAHEVEKMLFLDDGLLSKKAENNIIRLK